MHPKYRLQQHQLDPKKSLGQNFLFDQNVLARIVKAADLSNQDEVLEIGPGLGSLTGQLAQTAARVVAIEIDGRFLPILETELAPFKNIELIHGDILKQQPRQLFQKPYKVIANVPYYITGAILRHLLTAVHKPTIMVLTVQKEVAKRLTAQPPQMSLLAVSVQFYGRANIIAPIKAGAFWPKPDVHSSIIRIDIHPEHAVDEKAFFNLVKVGFSQKRKQLKNNLQALHYPQEQLMAALDDAQIDGRRRAQTLHIAEWIAIYNALISQRRRVK